LFTKRKLAKSTLILLPLFSIYYIAFSVWQPFVRGKLAIEFELIRLYFEIICSALQGLAISLIYCFFNSEVQQEIVKQIDRLILRYNPNMGQLSSLINKRNGSAANVSSNVSLNRVNAVNSNGAASSTNSKKSKKKMKKNNNGGALLLAAPPDNAKSSSEAITIDMNSNVIRSSVFVESQERPRKKSSCGGCFRRGEPAESTSTDRYKTFRFNSMKTTNINLENMPNADDAEDVDDNNNNNNNIINNNNYNDNVENFDKTLLRPEETSPLPLPHVVVVIDYNDILKEKEAAVVKETVHVEEGETAALMADASVLNLSDDPLRLLSKTPSNGNLLAVEPPDSNRISIGDEIVAELTKLLDQKRDMIE
jgi:hypothetical protein